MKLKTTNIEEQFVPYELSLKLKELDFDELCIAFFGKTSKYSKIKLIVEKSNYNKLKNSNEFIDAPLWQQCWKWFEDKYNLYMTIHEESLNGHRIGFYYSITENGWIDFYESIDDALIFDTKEEARLACLEKLIELC